MVYSRRLVHVFLKHDFKRHEAYNAKTKNIARGKWKPGNFNFPIINQSNNKWTLKK